MQWKTVNGEQESSAFADFHVLFEGMLEKHRLLDLLQNFICFSRDNGKDAKILAGYHQYFAVEKAIASTVKATETDVLPASTHERMRREASAGKQGGRTVEIQRLIGRSLRMSVDLLKVGENTVSLDCDVIDADGGTRCAGITSFISAFCFAKS